MVCGNRCWSEAITSGMHREIIKNRELWIYDGVPTSPYDMLVHGSRTHSDKTAIIDNNGRCYSFCDLLGLVDQFAALLHGRYQVQMGSHVGLILYNCVEFAVAFLAISKLRAVTVPLPSKYQKPEVLSLATKADVELVVCDEAFASWFVDSGIEQIVCRGYAEGYGFRYLMEDFASTGNVFSAAQMEDTAIIMFTSGTTAMSKGVVLKNYNIAHTIEAYRRMFRITDQDRSVIATPIYHVTGMIALLGLFLYVGGTLWLLNKVDPKRVLSCVKENELTFFHASPTVYHLLLEQRELFPSLPTLTRMACGSSNMPAGSIRKIKAWLPQVEFYTIYGMTEVSSPATTFPACATTSPYIESSGVPIPGLDLKIVDEAGDEVPNGEVGEIVMYGTGVLEEYYKQKSDLITADGWLKSNDLGYINEEGYLWIVDRKKDMINRGGEKICAYDVENVLHNLAEISEAVVVGIPDKMYNEIPVAAVKFEHGCFLTEEEITAYLRTQIARYQIPVKFCFVEEIPRTVNGKPDKNGVRALFLDGTKG